MPALVVLDSVRVEAAPMPLSTAAAWIGAGLLLLAGVAKVRRPDASGHALVLAGLPGSAWLVRALGLAEVVVALTGVLPGGPAWGLQAVIYTGFTVFVARERSRPSPNCGCFGEEGVPVTGLHVLVDAALAVGAGAAALVGAPGVFGVGAVAGGWLAVPLAVVAGLLRSHALILRQLHEAGLGLDSLDGAASTLPITGADGTVETGEVARPRTPRPSDAPAGRRVQDVAGRPALPEGVRLVVVTRGVEHELPAAVADHRVDVPVIMSEEAWTDYAVPGSPYAIHVDGPSGRVRGEGTGGDWAQVAQLLARATGDLAYVGEPSSGTRKARRDREVERDTDAELLAAGILPGDESLYRRADGSWVGPPEGDDNA